MTDHGGYTCLTFLTDYGTQDGFVAACRAQMLRHAPGLPVIDITHDIPPGDVRRGATVLNEPRIGAHGTPIIFIHPKNSNGVLIELMESPKGH